jgi:DNA-directed RNA polymerase subunit M/transcription elongation factor TFIIS
MSTTGQDTVVRFRCECGAVLTARAKLSGRKGKCKKCGNVLVIPAAEESLRADEAPDAVGIQEMCSVCQTVIEDDDARTTCNACKLPFHEECWQENLGCSAYGCSNVNALKQGADIVLNELPPPAHPRFHPARPQKRDEDDLPWDHLLLAASAIATVVGFVTCGVPTMIVIGLSGWRISHNVRNSSPVMLPVLALVLSSLGMLVGFCLSAGFWLI